VVILVLFALGLVAVFSLWQHSQRRLKAARQHIIEINDHLLANRADLAQMEALQTLSEAAYDALILIDQEHRIVTMNQQARSLFGYSQDLPPDSVGTLIAITRNHEIDALATEVIDTCEELGMQLSIDGSTYRVQTRCMPTDLGVYVALALEDVSELQRLNRARRDMVANVSHELRTPITSLRLLLDTLLRDDPPGKKRRKQILQKMVTETDTLQQMAQELLDLSMIESGRAEIIMNEVALRKIVARAIEHFSEQARRKSIAVSVDLPRRVRVLADAGQVERVLANLLHNAIKFTPPEGTITIHVTDIDEEWATVAVTDSGPGIAEDDRARIFERFYRSDQARRGSGTGLGLAIAKHIVQAHGGTIWAEEPPDPDPTLPGTRICFTLPLADMPEEAETAETNETPAADDPADETDSAGGPQAQA